MYLTSLTLFLELWLPFLSALDFTVVSSFFKCCFLSKCNFVKTPKRLDKCDHVYHLYVIQTDKRDELQKYLTQNGIGTSIHYPIPPHLQKAYSELGYKLGDFPIAEKLAKTSLSLPMYPGLIDSEIQYICNTVIKFLKN